MIYIHCYLHENHNKKDIKNNYIKYLLPKKEKKIFFYNKNNLIDLILEIEQDKKIHQHIFIDSRILFNSKINTFLTNKSTPIGINGYYKSDYCQYLKEKLKLNNSKSLINYHMIAIHNSYLKKIQIKIKIIKNDLSKIYENKMEFETEQIINDFLNLNNSRIKKFEIETVIKDNPFFTMDTFGKMGRLGNQIFQYIFLINLSKKHNRIVKLPSCYSHYDKLNITIDKMFNIKINYLDTLDYVNTILTYRENKYNYNEIFEQIEFKKEINYNFYGYYQSEKYFKDIKKDIENILKINDKIETIQLDKEKTNISIHIRRGDLVEKKQYGPPISVKYLQDSINYMRNNINNEIVWVIFSDDIEWSKNKLKLKEHMIYQNGDLYQDFKLMNECDHHIISNSTFSWWASYLNKNNNKIVVCPQTWFYKGFLPDNEDDSDLIIKDWKRL